MVEVVEESVNTEELLKALTSDEGLMADMRLIKLFNIIGKRQKRMSSDREIT